MEIDLIGEYDGILTGEVLEVLYDHQQNLQYIIIHTLMTPL